MIQVCSEDEEHGHMGREVAFNTHLIELHQLSKSTNSCSVHLITGGTEFHQAISSTLSSAIFQLSD